MHDFDVIVIGGGHAGTEAACAAARRGARVALLTFDRRTIGAMSCNPSIGGIGKGHLVREVDAFDGAMARAADSAAIHYRMLNRSKGVAVHGPRIQADRERYAAAIQSELGSYDALAIVEGEAIALDFRGDTIAGVITSAGDCLRARSVVLATGTFLGGRIFRGEDREVGGRHQERAATALGEQLRAFGLPVARLKTGTPPRLDGRTIDWGALPEQPSDETLWTMSPMTVGPGLPQISCAITRTTAASHDIIRNALHRSPLFTGAIEAEGPRYCPSIEDKVHRFGDRDGHQVFLEPEGLNTHWVYPNGISTSLPVETQQALIRSIPGLTDTAIIVPGYAVEYDYIDPRSLDRSLGSRAIGGLFHAGQINGTTGYEEAAAQGLVAGLNAAGYALDLPAISFDRSTSYIGVMIDDLTLQGVTEPYRMLTARAEHRLHLRADNAVTRLTADAIGAGCVRSERCKYFDDRQDAIRSARRSLDVLYSASQIADMGINVSRDGSKRPLQDWLGQFPAHVDTLAPDLCGSVTSDLLNELIEDARYAPYLAALDQASAANDDAMPIPRECRYDDVAGLSNEMKTRLSAACPETIGDVRRIRGISPAAITAVMLHVKRAA